MTTGEVVTKEFLEKAIGKNIKSFTVEAQDATGNNFMSVIYFFEVNFISPRNENNQEPAVETVHYICKCYPSNPGRQSFLNDQNYFWKELVFYKVWIPELQKFQQDLGIKNIVKPDFPEFVAGDAVNYIHSYEDKQDSNEASSSGKIYEPFDNYVMMVDLCETEGFKLPDRLKGLDKDHIMIAIEAYAKIHALSWAYKANKKIGSITEKFLNFKFDYSAGDTKKLIDAMCVSSVEEAVRSLESTGSSPELIAALAAYKEKSQEVVAIGFGSNRDTDKELDQYYRVKPAEFRQTDIPWRVIVHGDAHLNNMLFRYNPETEKPEKVVLVDLQVCREACPMVDLNHLMYSSTKTQFRMQESGSNINDILSFYVERFNYYCDLMKTETLPGFTFEEVQHRFNRLRIFGFCINLMSSPVLLKQRHEAVQLDSLTDMDQAEIMSAVHAGMSSNKKYNDTISALVNEGYSHGIL